SAVWTGTEMIIWGGVATTGVADTGARYDPATDHWTPLPTNGTTNRQDHRAVWTGREMIVWGGSNGVDPVGGPAIGFKYDPMANAILPMSAVNAPSPRWGHVALFTGQELVIWGGTDGYTALETGGRYDPASDRWTAMTQSGDSRIEPTGVWTGSEL